jgi:hypothetical protein
MMHPVEIIHRYTGAVLWTGKVNTLKDAPQSHLLGLAVVAALKAKADLSHANLFGAKLFDAKLIGANLIGTILSRADFWGANLGGLKLIARASRADYEFFMWSSILGGHIIRAACRTFTVTEYRAHVAKYYPGTDRAEETLAILDYLESRLNAFNAKVGGAA